MTVYETKFMKNKHRKQTYNQDKIKYSKHNESKLDYEKVYKDTIENIFIALDTKNINKYINSSILDKTSKRFIF
jgi:hypothetical protein